MSLETWLHSYLTEHRKQANPDDVHMASSAWIACAAEKAAELTALMGCGHPKACRVDIGRHEHWDYRCENGYCLKCKLVHDFIIPAHCTICAELAAITKERDALKREKEFALAEWSKVAKILDTLFSEAARRENADV